MLGIVKFLAGIGFLFFETDTGLEAGFSLECLFVGWNSHKGIGV